MNSLHDEMRYFFSKDGNRYYRSAFISAIVIVVMFTFILPNNQVLNGKIAVVDLDNSRYSHELIDKINASVFIDVDVVLNSPAEPEKLLYHDAYIAVLYLPEGLENRRYKGLPNSIGAFFDNTNSSQTGNVRSGLNEILAAENAAFSSMSGKTQAASGGMAIQERILFNTDGSYANTTILGILHMLASMGFCSAVLSILPRLRADERWREWILAGNPLSLAVRLLPYIVCLSAALALALGILRQINAFRFAGSLTAYFASSALTITALGLLCFILGWKAKSPNGMLGTVLVVPGFLFGGIIFPLPVLPGWLNALVNVFPLDWQFRFLRDIALRGAGFAEMTAQFGNLIVYVTILLGLFIIQFYREYRELGNAAKEIKIEKGV